VGLLWVALTQAAIVKKWITLFREDSGSSALGQALVPVPQRGVQVPVEPGDHVERDLLGAGGGALADVGAAAEPLGVVLTDHLHDPAVALGLALRQLAEVGDLGAEEQ
jgi:hypothetical protein